MRGTHPHLVPTSTGPGITPAYAGNTTTVTTWPMGAMDHPHVCGEHRKKLIKQGDAEGSPPRMRGTPGCVSLLSAAQGITPAYAGNTHEPKF